MVGRQDGYLGHAERKTRATQAITTATREPWVVLAALVGVGGLGVGAAVGDSVADAKLASL